MNVKLFLLALLTSSIIHAHASPRLIVQIVVDQLRGDLIHRYEQEFGNSGFKYLLNHGINFQNAHHPHANTTTCVGHATIATGSYPSLHGIVDNDWYDRSLDKLMYCVEDLSVRPLPTTHSKINLDGRSPRNLKASTLSDELILAQKGTAFAVSFKDRAAITLAGHAGKAFWFDKTNGGFITTNYYYTAYPQWVQEWNNKYQPQDYTWNLSRAKHEYQNAHTPTFPQHIKEFGQTFPHHITQAPTEHYFKLLAKTPKADQLTADFASQLLIAEKLGKNPDKTDYLGISFSAVDTIGHQFGSSSLEAEDNLLMLDHTLAHLLKTIDEQVGLNHTLIILTADHGAGDNPAYLEQHHIMEIQPLDVNEARKKIIFLLQQRYQLPAETLMSIIPPYVYLNHHIINEHQLNAATVSQAVAELLNHQPGVFTAYTLPITYSERNWVTSKVERMAYPYRAGDVYLVPPPYQSKGRHSDNRIAHDSPWQYDTYVPLLFVNANLHAQQISRPVFTTDIAPTLAALLMIKAPSATVGEPLVEVLNAMNKKS